MCVSRSITVVGFSVDRILSLKTCNKDLQHSDDFFFGLKSHRAMQQFLGSIGAFVVRLCPRGETRQCGTL